jgi:predicted RNA polymerase sigma factor
VTPVETAVREEWGRLLALLVAQYRRLDLAEDGLADAVEAAARTWPSLPGGAPANPAAWLLTAARRRVVDRLRRESVAARSRPLLAVDAELSEGARRTMADAGVPDGLTDERLRLVLLCAHPSLRPEAAAALTLRMVLGVSTEDLARLFLVRTSTMAARLTRARKSLAHEAFTVPTGTELGSRVAVVADVAYLAFTAGYAAGSGPDLLRADVSAEAIRLVRVLRDVLNRDDTHRGEQGSEATDASDGERSERSPRSAPRPRWTAELRGAERRVRRGPGPKLAGVSNTELAGVSNTELDALLALMLLQHSRRDARIEHGRLVLLPDQDRARWHQDEIAEGLALLEPLVHDPPAPYLLQALIAAEHAIAHTSAHTEWGRIVTRYDELLALGDSPVVRLNRAVAVAEADGPLAGLAALADCRATGHRYDGVRAELLARAGLVAEAVAAYDAALASCGNETERAHLAERKANVLRDGVAH